MINKKMKGGNDGGDPKVEGGKVFREMEFFLTMTCPFALHLI